MQTSNTNEEVAKNYEVIREGENRNGEQIYLLQLTDKHNNTLTVELSDDGTSWNINTAGVFKTSYGRNNKVVYNRQTTAKQPAEAIEASQSVEQNGTQSPSSLIDAPTPNVPYKNKDTNSVPNVQENEVKNSLREAIGKEVKYSVKDKRKSAPETVSVLREHLQTAISSTDDGTNVLNKIDTAIDKYENVKRANTFLGDLANAIGAKKRGSECERN